MRVKHPRRQPEPPRPRCHLVRCSGGNSRAALPSVPVQPQTLAYDRTRAARSVRAATAGIVGVLGRCARRRGTGPGQCVVWRIGVPRGSAGHSLRRGHGDLPPRDRGCHGERVADAARRARERSAQPRRCRSRSAHRHAGAMVGAGRSSGRREPPPSRGCDGRGDPSRARPARRRDREQPWAGVPTRPGQPGAGAGRGAAAVGRDGAADGCSGRHARRRRHPQLCRYHRPRPRDHHRRSQCSRPGRTGP